MNTRKARLIRAGILAARDPELAQYAHLGHRLVREACRRELNNIKDRSDRALAWAYIDAWLEEDE